MFQTSISFADPCSDVVSDTVAELRAGAGGSWSEDIEGLVRAAAGSACIKAQSKRYQTATHVSGEEAPSPGTQSASVDETQGRDADAKADDDGSWNIGGLTIRSMSGSPSQKPYERARQTKKAQNEQEEP